MSFGEAIRAVLHRYADFDGRAARPELWWWLLFVTLVAAALELFSVVPIGDTGDLGSLLSGLWGIAVLLPTLAVGTRLRRLAQRQPAKAPGSGCAWTTVSSETARVSTT